MTIEAEGRFGQGQEVDHEALGGWDRDFGNISISGEGSSVSKAMGEIISRE